MNYKFELVVEATEKGEPGVIRQWEMNVSTEPEDEFIDFQEDRPWGTFLQFQRPACVKLLIVKPGKSLSLQKHKRRSEKWIVLHGNPTITAGNKVSTYHVGGYVWIKPGDKHRIVAQEQLVVIQEISWGEFDEDDIIRLEDDFGRVTKDK